MTTTAARPRLVIYTVLTGSKEPLGDPLAGMPPGLRQDSDLEIGFVCFTDNRALRSEVWQFRYIDDIPLPAEKLSRRPKALPHEYLQDWDYSLYVDNIVVFKRLPQQRDLALDAPEFAAGSPVFRTFPHTTRSNPQQEAEAIIQLGYESAERICGQLDFYAGKKALAEITPLSTCTVILRQHMHPTLIRFGQTWWEQILNFCKRDQMSFDFARQWSGAQIRYFAGLKHDNDLIQNSANISPNRVHANFDAVRYAWQHRSDAAAQKDPRQHYLDHGRHEGKQFSAPLELLEFLCHRHGSSLGSRIAPRRQMASALQQLLQPRRQAGGRLLLVQVAAAGPLAFDAEERARAEAALCAFLPAHRGTRIDLTEAQLAGGQLAFRPEDGGFDLVLVIGAPGASLHAVHTLVAGALLPIGLLCLLGSESCELSEVAAVEAALTARLGGTGRCRAQLHGTQHDGATEALANGLLAFSWAPSAAGPALAKS
ncbi:glycosyltransferase domain-containing protein [Roseateles sp.]|uniref:glycosyltransferase domain-containing protein n=1 Tax=Roseateles sp. TaxID=1971397 RepID=UPI003D124DDD